MKENLIMNSRKPNSIPGFFRYVTLTNDTENSEKTGYPTGTGDVK